MARDTENRHGARQTATEQFLRRGALLVLVAIALAGMAAVVWYAARVLLLIFAAILLAVFLRSLAAWISRWTNWPPRRSLAAVTAGLLLLAAGALLFIAPRVAEQAAQMSETLPRSWQHFRDWVGQYGWGRFLIGNLKVEEIFSRQQGVLAKAGASTVGFFIDLVIILFVGLYLAANPATYTSGVTRLFPRWRRARVREIFNRVGETLRWELTGRVGLMILNAVVTTVGLALMGIPLALTLGLLSGLLNFIPNFGPVVAAIPALLLALMDGPTKALYVLIFYAAYQALDGYVLTPMVQQRMIAIPPALTISAQVLFSVLFGVLGLLLAVPITAVIFVVVRMSYLEDS